MGFRPAIYRLAAFAGLTGRVWNDPGGATVEIEGPDTVVHRFADELAASLPPLARLDALEITEIQPESDTGFVVVESEQGRPEGASVPPDAALCAACARDMGNPSDRRHNYPFTTCTDCGPRYSLVHSLPYDRARTSMSCFPLCPECEKEYRDPTDRRFHAEPVCCPACGPRLWLQTAIAPPADDGNSDPVTEAAKAIDAGRILGVKGLGGFQLACRADQADVVERLRQRKQRPTKPFAIMVRDLEAARELVHLESLDEKVMTSPRCPIMLARARDGAPVASNVAPGVGDLGVILPTTPLHVILMRQVTAPALVMTSGNASDEPICKGNREAVTRLAEIADDLLLHDRDVVRRVDDSVMRSAPDGPFLVRRARGWVPEPVAIPDAASEPLLAVGAHLQVTAAVARRNEVILTPHIGDLDSEEARLFHREAIDHLEAFLEVRPSLIVADAHPDYPSRWAAEAMARDRKGRLILVQHHLAHAAATLAEHGRLPSGDERALGLALDGTGWGPDGTTWGGEWLLIDGTLSWRRVACLEPLPLVGGEAAVRAPWRVAVAALVAADASALLSETPMAGLLTNNDLETVARLAKTGDWPLATGAGRLFEACGALLGLGIVNAYEGELAIRLEAAAAGARAWTSWPEVALDEVRPELPSSALLAAAATRAIAGEDTTEVAAGFHTTFCQLANELTRRIVALHPGTSAVAAGGGCLANRLLRQGLLDGNDRAVLLPTRLPPGDGGVAYGQAVLAASCLARGLDTRRLELPLAVS